MAAESKSNEAVGFIGLGLMGEPMAGNILKKGHKLTVWNRSIQKADALKAEGAVVAASAAEAAYAGKFVVLMLAHVGACKEVISNILQAAKTDGTQRILINCSTVSKAESEALAASVNDANKGWTYVAAPVVGTTPQAKAAILGILVGAKDPAHFDQVKDILSSMGKPQHVGSIGQEAVMKLAVNQMLFAYTSAYSFSRGLVEKGGLDPKLFAEWVKENGRFHCPWTDFLESKVASRNYEPVMFPTNLAAKDLGCMIDTANELGVDSNGVSGLHAQMAAAAKDNGDKNFTVVYDTINPK